MNHRLHTDLRGRLSDVLAGEFLTLDSRVDLMATVAIATVLDDLIAGAQHRQSHPKNGLDEAHWKLTVDWIAARKAEVLA